MSAVIARRTSEDLTQNPDNEMKEEKKEENEGPEDAPFVNLSEVVKLWIDMLKGTFCKPSATLAVLQAVQSFLESLKSIQDLSKDDLESTLIESFGVESYIFELRSNFNYNILN